MSEAVEIDERLQAYFDDELEASERAEVETKLASDPALGERLEDLHFLRKIVAGDLEAQGEAVHEARFEQIWDEFDQQLDRQVRLQEAADHRPSLFTRLVAMLKPIRMPLATAAVAATVAVIVVKATDDDDANNVAAVTSDSNEASTQPTPAEKGEPAAEQPPSPTPAPKLAHATEIEPVNEVFAPPESNNAEIETIEFGGRSGSIAHIEGSRGTTTVIWVVEDDETVDSERSL